MPEAGVHHHVKRLAAERALNGHEFFHVGNLTGFGQSATDFNSANAGQPVADQRRVADQLRRPSSDLRRPIFELRRLADDLRRVFLDLRRPSGHLRRRFAGCESLPMTCDGLPGNCDGQKPGILPRFPPELAKSDSQSPPNPARSTGRCDIFVANEPAIMISPVGAEYTAPMELKFRRFTILQRCRADGAGNRRPTKPVDNLRRALLGSAAVKETGCKIREMGC